ncbi:MAG: tetratricopeptide repeat protein, partial [Candidatus Eremiobacteraeota bacterium]|nr:tetratricopeptide repeat protein [Candidatus Eremiobacteraeota bacterium]
GQVELTNGLAAAYNRRSEALLLLGKTAAALENAEMAINYYKDAVVSLERNDLMRLLALAYLNRGEVRRARGELSEARDDISEAIDIYESLGELGEHDRTEQAHAYRSRGVVGLSLGEYELAQEDSTQALEILTGLAEAHHHQEFRNELAAAYNNRAAALHRQGEFELALEDYDQAVALRQQLVDEGRLDLRTDLAITHTNRGLVRTGVGEVELALEDYEMAIAIRTQLVSAEGRLDLRGQLAFTRVCRGSTYRALGQRQQAVDDYRRATEEYNLAAADEDVELDTWADMALAFGSLGALYLDVGEPEHCLACCDRALELYDRIPEVEADPVYRFEMAVAHNNRGEACKALGDIEKAESCYREATRRYQLLVESEGRHDLAGELAGAYQNHAQVLVILGHGEQALERVEHAITLYEQQTDAIHRLAAALLIRASGKAQAGDHQAAFGDLERALEIYSNLVINQGRLDFHDELAQTYQQRAVLHFELGASEQALADIERAVVHFERAWEFTRDEQWRRELVGALVQRAGYHRAIGDQESAAADVMKAFGFGGRTTLPSDFQAGGMLEGLAREAESLANSGHLERAKQKWDSVIKLSRVLNGGPHLPDAEARLAAGHFRRGWLLHRQGKATTADLDLARAVDTYSVLVSLGGRTDLFGDLAGAYLARGRHLASMGRVGRALPQFDYALEIFSELRTSDPQWGRALALGLLERADLVVARRDPARAVVDLTRAGQVLDGLTDSSPESLGQAKALCQLQLATAVEALGRERDAYRAYLKAAYKFADLIGAEPGPSPHRAGCVEALGRAAQLAPPAEAGHHWLNVLGQVTAGLACGQDLTSLVALDGLNDYLQKLSETDPRVVVSIVDVLTQFPTAGGPHPAWKLFAPTISKVVLDPHHDEALVERLVGSVGQAVAALPKANEELPWLKDTLELLALHPHHPGESLRLAIRGLGDSLAGLAGEVRERFALTEDLVDSLRAR